MNHPNICPIYGLEYDAAYSFFVVKKWLEGQSLSETRLAREQVVSVLEKVADALDYAHSEGRPHQDVKPSNIFLGTDGKVTLIDFGIAVNLHSETQATRGQFSTSGTDKYMAPEQRTGQLQTAQTDEYSLALVALELLAGTLSPLAYRRISPEIQNVLDVALSDSPSERYATCRAFVDALSSIRRDDVPVVQRTSSSAKVRETGAFDELINLERHLDEKKRRTKEEKPRQEIQTLEEAIQTEFQAERYVEAIGHLNQLLKLKPENQNARWQLKRYEEKLEVQKEEHDATLDRWLIGTCLFLSFLVRSPWVSPHTLIYGDDASSVVKLRKNRRRAVGFLPAECAWKPQRIFTQRVFTSLFFSPPTASSGQKARRSPF